MSREKSSKAIPKVEPTPVPAPKAYLTWEDGDDAGRAIAYASASAGPSDSGETRRTVFRSAGRHTFTAVTSNTSVREGYSRSDYDDFREGESVPEHPRDVIRCLKRYYKKVGIFRNTVDMMADFGSQGVRVNHPVPSIERFYQDWFERVAGVDFSERFLNYLYRHGHDYVRRFTAKIPVRLQKQMRAVGAPDLGTPEEPKYEKRVIPWKYILLNPLSVDAEEDELQAFAGGDRPKLYLRINRKLLARIRNPQSNEDKAAVAKLPTNVVSSLLKDDRVPLDEGQVAAFYYKRDHGECYASPMAEPIVSDLQVLAKLKLTDLAALDGAISCIRVWKLGNIEARMMPTDVAINRLAEMLCNNVGGGVMDLVWGPDLELVETSTEVHRFLGKSKYEPTLEAIYAGLGVPPALTGGGAGGVTTNFMSLETLVKRLEYGRQKLREFWDYEIKLVQKACGFAKPAEVTFDHIDLSDATSRNTLLIQLVDRNIISDEAVQSAFGFSPVMERERLKRESKGRVSGKIPPKAGQFHNAEKEFDLKKQLLVSGEVAPSEVGVELDEKKSGETRPSDRPAKETPSTKPKGDIFMGRPKNSTDKKKRKRKQVKPRTSASLMTAATYAHDAYNEIGKLASPAVLESLGKKTLRELTESEAEQFEDWKFQTLCAADVGRELSREFVGGACETPTPIPEPVTSLLKAALARHSATTGKEPTAEQRRYYRCMSYALWKTEDPVETPSVAA